MPQPKADPSRQAFADHPDLPIRDRADGHAAIATAAALRDTVPALPDQPSLPAGSAYVAEDLIRRATLAYRSGGMMTDVQGPHHGRAPAKADDTAAIAVSVGSAPDGPEGPDLPRPVGPPLAPAPLTGAATLDAGTFPPLAPIPVAVGPVSPPSVKPPMDRTRSTPAVQSADPTPPVALHDPGPTLGVAPDAGVDQPVIEPAGGTASGPQGSTGFPVEAVPAPMPAIVPPSPRADANPAPTAPLPAVQGQAATAARDLAAEAAEAAEARPFGPGDVATGEFAPTGTAAMPGGVAAPDPAQPLRQAPQSPVGITQIAPLAVAIATDPGSGALEVALSPDELGRLHMQVTTEGDTLRIVMTVERPETLDLLRRHSDQLLADLRQAGFGGTSLSFGQGSAGDGRTAGNAPTETLPLPDAVRSEPAPGYPHRSPGTNAPLDLRL